MYHSSVPGGRRDCFVATLGVCVAQQDCPRQCRGPHNRASLRFVAQTAPLFAIYTRHSGRNDSYSLRRHEGLPQEDAGSQRRTLGHTILVRCPHHALMQCCSRIPAAPQVPCEELVIPIPQSSATPPQTSGIFVYSFVCIPQRYSTCSTHKLETEPTSKLQRGVAFCVLRSHGR